MNLAVWSGPRNLSTALMYSFAQRGDCDVWDEPFYAAYLSRTGLNHPLRDEIIASQDTHPEKVIAACTVPRDRVQYQKHMCQHMLDGDDLSWIAELQNVLLIRHPARVIASYHAKRENPVSTDLGFERQAQIFDLVAARGVEPIVVDATDIRANPKGMIEVLCTAIGIAFDPAMLNWPKGGNKNDGVWASHWYNAVHQSTGFAPPEQELPELPNHLRPILDDCLPHYEKLAAVKLTA